MDKVYTYFNLLNAMERILWMEKVYKYFILLNAMEHLV